MPARYLLADYETEKSEKPRVEIRTDDLEHSKRAFKKSSQRKIKSAVLFDTEKNEVLLVAIEGEPIHLVNVIEFAREHARHYLPNIAAKATAGTLIGQIVKAMAGEAVPGVADAVIAHVLGPYYAFKGDGANAAGAAAALWGGVSGAIVGTLVGGPVGAIVGGMVGGAGAGAGAKGIVKAFTLLTSVKPVRGLVWSMISVAVPNVWAMDTASDAIAFQKT